MILVDSKNLGTEQDVIELPKQGKRYSVKWISATEIMLSHDGDEYPLALEGKWEFRGHQLTITRDDLISVYIVNPGAGYAA